MVKVFHGHDAETHDAFQTWRKANGDGFFMTECAPGQFTVHYAQDRREHPGGRSCMHNGTSENGYREDKGGCYTTARKACSDSLPALLAWDV